MGSIKVLHEQITDRGKIEIRDERGHHFTMVDDEFIDKFARVVGVQAFCVYMVLCRHSGRDKACWPSIGLISDKLGTSERVVRRSVKVLEGYRIISVQRPRGFHNTYHLLERSKWKADRSYYQTGGGHRATKSERAGVKVDYDYAGEV